MPTLNSALGELERLARRHEAETRARLVELDTASYLEASIVLDSRGSPELPE